MARFRIEDLMGIIPDDQYNKLTEGKKAPNKFRAKPMSADENPYGIRFDSKMEFVIYDLLTKFNIPFEYQPRFEVLPSLNFRDDEKPLKPIHYTPDFFLPEHKIYVEAKGSRKTITDASRLRMILFKHYLHRIGDDSVLVLVEKGKEMAFVSLFLQDFDIKKLKPYRI